jgi:hypothetical protein
VSFTATAGATKLTLAGYQVLAAEEVTNISLAQTGGGPNLLGATWDFTPAPSGSNAAPFNDGTSVPALSFAGTTEDSFDMFSQTVPTVAGQSYILNFLFSGFDDPPSELVVSTAASAAAVPEPATLTMAVIGGLTAGGIGWMRRRRARGVNP